MKISYKIAAFILFLATINSTAQGKIKGNKVVTTEDRNISEFKKIEVIDNVNVLLVYNENQSVAVEADSNLQSSIITEVKGEILTIRTSNVIGRKKALNIHLNVNKNLREINAYNKAEISSKNSLSIDTITLNCFDNSKYDIKLNSKTVHIHENSNNRVNVKVLCDDVVIRTQKFSKLTGTIDTKKIQITATNKSAISLNGSTHLLEMNVSGDSSFKGKDFEITNATIKSYNSTNIYVRITEKFELYANNSSEINLYANPKITIHEFYDKALIRKRELN